MTTKFSNFARGTLSQAVEAADTAIFLSAADVALLPALGASDDCYLTLWDDVSDPEIVRVTDVDTGTGELTVVRARESTVAVAWSAGTRWVLSPTASILESVFNAIAGTSRYVGTTTYSSNDYTLTIGASQTLPTFADGEELVIDPPTANSSASSDTPRVRVTNGTDTSSYYDIVRADGSPCQDGDIEADFLTTLRFHEGDGNFRIISRYGFNLAGKDLNGGPWLYGWAFNGLFDKWTAGATINTPASGTEGPDGWYPSYDGSIGTFSLSRQSFTVGQTAVPGEPQYFCRWDHTVAGSGSALRYFNQKLKGGLRRHAGRKKTYTIWLKADSARTVTVAVLQHFGTGGSPSSDVTAGSQAFNLTTSWQRCTLTVDHPSISGKTFGSGADDGVIFRVALPLNTTMTVDFAYFYEQDGSLSGTPPTIGFPLPFSVVGNGVSTFSETLLDDTTAGAWLTTLGISAYAQTLLDDANAGAALTTLGISAYAQTLLDDANAGAALTTLGIAAFPQTLLDDTTAGAVLTTLGVSAFAQTLLDDANASDFITTLGASNILTALLAVDGAGSGLDADLLDGISSAAFAQLSGATFTGDVLLSGTGSPLMYWSNTSGATDQKRWGISVNSSGTMLWRPITDAGGNGSTALSFTQSAATPLVAEFDVVDLRMEPTPASLATNSVGFRGAPVNSGEKSSGYTGALQDAGGAIPFTATATFTIPANSNVAYPIGTILMLPNLNGGGTLTIHPDTGVTLRRGDGTAGTGDRTLAADRFTYLWKRGTNEWYIIGGGFA